METAVFQILTNLPLFSRSITRKDPPFAELNVGDAVFVPGSVPNDAIARYRETGNPQFAYAARKHTMEGPDGNPVEGHLLQRQPDRAPRKRKERVEGCVAQEAAQASQEAAPEAVEHDAPKGRRSRKAE